MYNITNYDIIISSYLYKLPAYGQKLIKVIYHFLVTVERIG